jgi:hypothetical protein
MDFRTSQSRREGAILARSALSISSTRGQRSTGECAAFARLGEVRDAYRSTLDGTTQRRRAFDSASAARRSARADQRMFFGLRA